MKLNIKLKDSTRCTGCILLGGNRWAQKPHCLSLDIPLKLNKDNLVIRPKICIKENGK